MPVDTATVASSPSSSAPRARIGRRRWAAARVSARRRRARRSVRAAASRGRPRGAAGGQAAGARARPLARLCDKPHRGFKTGALLTPGYLVRNLLGDLWNAHTEENVFRMGRNLLRGQKALERARTLRARAAQLPQVDPREQAHDQAHDEQASEFHSRDEPQGHAQARGRRDGGRAARRALRRRPPGPLPRADGGGPHARASRARRLVAGSAASASRTRSGSAPSSVASRRA